MLRFIAGLLVGAGIALVIAPTRGSVLRRRVRENLADLSQMPRRKASELLDRYEGKISRAGEQLGRQVAEAAVGKVKHQLNQRESA